MNIATHVPAIAHGHRKISTKMRAVRPFVIVMQGVSTVGHALCVSRNELLSAQNRDLGRLSALDSI